jgi:outer membrane PBP1 activator LpoA protein
MSHKLRLTLLAVLAAVVLTACGGSSATSSRAELVAKADPICKQVAAKRSAANAELSKAGATSTKGLKVLARVAPGVADDEHQAVAQLRSLKAPTDLTSDWQQLLNGMQKLADDATEIGTEAKAGQLKKVEAITASGRTLRQELTAIASRDGFTYCGRTS